MKDSLSNLTILIPAYNPNQNIINLVNDLLSYNWNEIVIVNDGSSLQSKNIFDELDKFKNVTLLSHADNQGKGSALKTGINHIRNHSVDIDGIITVDSDGQHLIKDVIKIAQQVIARKQDVIFGVRSFDENIPLRSKFGNQITKHFIYIFNGISLEDTQTGLRYLPTSIFDDILQLPGKKYEFELECIFLSKKLGYSITQIPIETIYIDNNSESHFRPLIDSARIYLVFVRFSFSSLISYALDIALFAFLISFNESILYATFFARSISGIFNFYLNRNFVFRVNRKNDLLRESLRYILLWFLLLVLSGSIVSLLQGYPAYAIIPFKIFIDLLLFIIAFYVQKNFVFRPI